MRKKDRCIIINYAVKDYCKIFDETLVPVKLTEKLLNGFMKEYGANSMCEWYYCCQGWQFNCWQEPYEVGNWGMTQAEVEKRVVETVKACLKACRQYQRAYICRAADHTRLYIIMRDTDHKCDYLFSFYNDDEEEKSA